MYQSVDLYYEPLEILERLSNGNRAEMTTDELAFLCGMIKERKPKKIVEIGVAAGGTTAVILNCITTLGLKAKMYSIDLMTTYYRDRTKEAGYLAKECKTLLHEDVDHTFYTGKYAAECLEAIGNDIDFLILDTVHSLPGEIFDFLACFPFLKQGTTVVLHDVLLNHLGDNPNAFATKLLFDSVTGMKFMNTDDDGKLIGIGAFVITEDTQRYIADVFSVLTITWKYIPAPAELAMYRAFLEKYYPVSYLKWLDMVIELNRTTLKKKSEGFLKICKWITSIRANRIYVYGCGNFGKAFYGLLEQCGMKPEGYIISDGQIKSEEYQDVYYLSEVSLNERDMILVGVNVSLQKEICDILQSRGIRNYILPDEGIFPYLVWER